uniref:NADH-ubiquinone oxidoreductase subunit B14.7 n=1 Tax=Clytia hemisphaerica TaxID=252671 RepID=A0A7M5U7P5_9CNID
KDEQFLFLNVLDKKMKLREGEPPDWNDHENFGPLLLKEFDHHPGDNVIDKAVFFGTKGLIVGSLYGGFHAAIFEPALGVNGLGYAMRHIATFGALTGGAGLVLGAGIPIAQAVRKKNDPIAWMWGGFAAGAVFALKSGRFGRAIQYGSATGLFLAFTKTMGTYQRPYVDPWANLRQPKPDTLPLFDKDGNMYTHKRQSAQDL